MNTRTTRTRRYQKKQQSLGNCVACGKPRGDSGSVQHCEYHLALARQANQAFNARRDRARREALGLT